MGGGCDATRRGTQREKEDASAGWMAAGQAYAAGAELLLLLLLS